MAKYTIQFQGEVEVEAENEDDAYDQAWIEHRVRGDDIQSIECEEPELNAKQEEALKHPCPECGAKLEEVGDLADFAHNIVTCSNAGCGFALFFDGENDG